MAGSSSPDDAATWNGVAAQYDSCVLDNLARDLNFVLQARLTEICDGLRARASSGAGEPAINSTARAVDAVDFGCGAGKWLAELAARCDTVLSLSLSLSLSLTLSLSLSLSVPHLLPNVCGNNPERWT